MVDFTTPDPVVLSILPSERSRYDALLPALTIVYFCCGGGFMVCATVVPDLILSTAPSDRSRYVEC